MNSVIGFEFGQIRFAHHASAMDSETKALLETMTEAMRQISGTLVLQKARIEALEEFFLAWQKKRGADVNKLRTALDRLQEALAQKHLTRIGDTHPEAAQAVDIQGLLSKLLDDLESPDNRS